jgi:hypothetical protein
MTRFKKETKKIRDNCDQIRAILAEEFQAREELEERINFAQEKLKEEMDKFIRLEKTANPQLTVKELAEKHYCRPREYWGTCHCDKCVCSVKLFSKCFDKFGCRTKTLEKPKQKRLEQGEKDTK